MYSLAKLLFRVFFSLPWGIGDFCCRMELCFSRFNVVFQLDENLAVFLRQFHLEATFRLCFADFC